MNIERPLKKIKLPVSKYTALVVPFFTRNEMDEFKKAQWGGKAEMKFVDNDLVIDKIPSDYQQQEDNSLVLIGVRRLEKGESKIDMNVDILNELPNADVVLLIKELRTTLAGNITEKKE